MADDMLGLFRFRRSRQCSGRAASQQTNKMMMIMIIIIIIVIINVAISGAEM
jgi:hypothetical protein